MCTFLLHHALIKMLTAIFIVGVITFILSTATLIPMKFGWVKWGSYWGTATHGKYMWVVSQQTLTALFSYHNMLSLPWRASVAVHLTCSNRDASDGRDLYGARL